MHMSNAIKWRLQYCELNFYEFSSCHKTLVQSLAKVLIHISINFYLSWVLRNTRRNQKRRSIGVNLGRLWIARSANGKGIRSIRIAKRTAHQTVSFTYIIFLDLRHLSPMMISTLLRLWRNHFGNNDRCVSWFWCEIMIGGGGT